MVLSVVTHRGKSQNKLIIFRDKWIYRTVQVIEKSQYVLTDLFKTAARGVGGGKFPKKVKKSFYHYSCFSFLALKSVSP